MFKSQIFNGKGGGRRAGWKLDSSGPFLRSEKSGDAGRKKKKTNYVRGSELYLEAKRKELMVWTQDFLGLAANSGSAAARRQNEALSNAEGVWDDFAKEGARSHLCEELNVPLPWGGKG